jgi:hypothetical protein
MSRIIDLGVGAVFPSDLRAEVTVESQKAHLGGGTTAPEKPEGKIVRTPVHGLRIGMPRSIQEIPTFVHPG